jgi:tetratricopeptide (TPR) repeat protein
MTMGQLLYRGIVVKFLALSVASAAATCPELVGLAQAAFANKQYPQAAERLEQALNTCPQQVPVLFDLAKTRMMTQEFERAVEALGRLLTLEPRHPLALKLRGDALYLLGKTPEAEQSLKAAIAAQPANPETHYALGRILYQENRYVEAIAELVKVTELDPKSYRAYDNLGLAYEAIGNTPQAIASYKRAMELSAGANPPYDWVYANMSNLLHRSGDYQQAFQFGAEAAHRNPDSARNFFLTGRALAKLERWELAAKWLAQSVTLDPRYAEARYLYSTVLRKLGRSAEAAAQLAAFREINASQPRNRR